LGERKPQVPDGRIDEAAWSMILSLREAAGSRGGRAVPFIEPASLLATGVTASKLAGY
jgi:hypothetical protein